MLTYCREIDQISPRGDLDLGLLTVGYQHALQTYIPKSLARSLAYLSDSESLQGEMLHNGSPVGDLMQIESYELYRRIPSGEGLRIRL